MTEKDRLVGERAVDKAIAEGRLLESSRERYLELYEQSPKATLITLERKRAATTERGRANG